MILRWLGLDRYVLALIRLLGAEPVLAKIVEWLTRQLDKHPPAPGP